ncbi:hypothetical protein HMPREF1565_0322 [Providencia alcalifaciens RIMD 1656011]|uniref:Uncharacterized protein n=1 Tax=Providencia alcalifaciens DSM 30120 TaxID=520999 RepID=B6XCX2_9GAMM|nr:hypothetical protein PROVALCAL_01189 [Providencia alcalifaciens DSM 30120]EUD03301.1 hypothetical protein HMPREF1565_0322 [Providencia alcalifaciens RIMD 1656011]
MKTIQVTAPKLNGSISFEVHQKDQRLVKGIFTEKLPPSLLENIVSNAHLMI